MLITFSYAFIEKNKNYFLKTPIRCNLLSKNGAAAYNNQSAPSNRFLGTDRKK